MKKQFGGLIVPVLTPVDEWGNLDEKHFAAHLEDLVQRGVNGLYITGTTGEAAQLPIRTWEAANRVALRVAGHTAAKVYSGAVFPNTLETIDRIHQLEDMGADTVFATPTFYYTDGTQEQVLNHFDRITRHINANLIVYSISVTTHVDIHPDTLKTLSAMPHVIGVKDTRVDWPSHLANIRALRDTDVGIACVPEALIAPSLLSGSDGVVTALGNFMPEYYLAILTAAENGDAAGVLSAHEAIMAFDGLLRCPGGNGVAKLKYLGSLIGICQRYTAMSTMAVTKAQMAVMEKAAAVIKHERQKSK